MAAPGDMEQRLAIELRLAPPTGKVAGGAASGPGRLCGVAAPFGVPAQIGGFTEVIRRGAFAGSLSGMSDIRCLVDHDDGKLLGRTRSGTLRLFEKPEGLVYEIDLPPTQLGNDIHALATRGDLSGCSFGFTVAPGGEAWPDMQTRHLCSVNLVEVSILHRLPAYDQTTISARARQLGRAEASARLRRIALV